jgi:putative transposase
MSHCAADACPVEPAQTGYLLVVETQEEPGMQHRNSIFASLLKAIPRRWFKAAVERHGGDDYDKSFRSWDHMITLIFAQFCGADSLRGLEAVWNAHSHHHYHLGSGKLARSTLSDANARRPVAIFAETFDMLSRLAEPALRREGSEMLRLLDATPIPLDEIVSWAEWNGRTRGLKLHVVYDPAADHPRRIEITPATVNDVQVGKTVPIEPGATYVFDKGYCDYAWWTQMHEAGSFFITRRKTNATYKVVRRRPLRKTRGDGFTILDDAEVRLATQGHAKLAISMRRVRLKRDDGAVLTLITNDLHRPAVEIAALYKLRWQIELLFRWIKQHLKLRKFLGRSPNAVRLQIVAAMIAYLLLRIAARNSRVTLPAIRFANLVSACLFVRKPLAKIQRPPDVHPSKSSPRSPGQLELAYA